MDLMKGANRALMHKLSSGRGTEAFSMGPNDWAKNMMKKMGWTEGKGIGKKEDGIVKHIRVDKKDGNDGLGAVDIDVLTNPQCSIDHWSDTFNSVKVNIRCGSSDDDSDSDSSSTDSSDSDEEMVSTTGANATSNDIYRQMYKACKGRRIGQRNHGVQRGKWQRTEGTDRPSTPGDGASAPSATPTASAASAAVAAAAIKGRQEAKSAAKEEKKKHKKTKKKTKKKNKKEQMKMGKKAQTAEAASCEGVSATAPKRKAAAVASFTGTDIATPTAAAEGTNRKRQKQEKKKKKKKKKASPSSSGSGGGGGGVVVAGAGEVAGTKQASKKDKEKKTKKDTKKKKKSQSER